MNSCYIYIHGIPLYKIVTSQTAARLSATRGASSLVSARGRAKRDPSRAARQDRPNFAGINVQLAALSEAAAIDSRALKEKISKTQLLVEELVAVVHRYARELSP